MMTSSWSCLSFREEAQQKRLKLLNISLILLTRSLSLHRSHTAHTSAEARVATMYKMYNTQSDDDSDNDKSSLNSSFWSDGERQEDEEEEEEKVEIERVISEEETKPVGDTEETLQETSVDGKLELKEGNISGESLVGGIDDDDVDDEESCSSSCDSPAPSLMTSGYGTYRPEEQEGGDYRDDHTITEFDQDSRGDLSEVRDDEEDDRSLCSFSWFDRFEPTEPDYDETYPLSVLADTEPEANCGDDGLREEVDITDMKPEEDKDQEGEKEFEDLHAASRNEVTDGTLEEQHHNAVAEDKFILDEKRLEGDSVNVEQGKLNERQEEVQGIKEENKVESEDPDESSSNKDIKFIDSKVDFSQMTYEEMCKEWEGNLRQKKGKWFPVCDTYASVNSIRISGRSKG